MEFWRFTTPGFDRPKTIFSGRLRRSEFARGHGALSYVNLQRAFIDEPKDRAARLKPRCARGAAVALTSSIVSATARSDALCA
jgi:hypothetical protein